MSIKELLTGSNSGVEAQTDIAVGERVRSYDFAGNMTCYVEGVVTRITESMQGCPRYEIRVDKRVWDDKEVSDFDDTVYPPINGLPTMFGRGVTNLVVRVTH